MSLEINSNEVQSITRNNKRVVLIVKNSDGSVIYDVGGISSILLTATSQSLCYVDNESATLTASVYDNNDEAVTGQTVNLYDSSDNLIGAMTDNDDGTYTYTYTPSSSGVVTFYAKVSGRKSNDLVISSSKRATDITFTASSNSVVYSNSITLSGTLKHNNTGLSSASVKIYDGNTLIDTVTVTDGAFSKTISDLGVGSHTFSAVYDGDTNYNDAIISDVSVTITQHGTTLNINVPTTLVYSDEFNITGTLTDGTNVIAGATVNLLVGSTVVDSDTTDSNGQVSFTQTPVSMGTHTFQLSYAGTTNYSGATSSTVTRDINKETSVLTVTNPSNSSSTMYSDGTLEVTGSLVTDDGEPISGATITIKESTTTLGTATTGSDGGFSKNLSLATGTHELTIGFATDTYYTASSASKTVVVSDPNISLTVATYDSNDTQISSASSSAILSYADSEYAVLTATYLGANVSGKTISFDIIDSSTGNVIENIDTATTDSNGVCSVEYQSKGIGDISIRASVGSILSSYPISDRIYYNATEQSLNTTGTQKVALTSGVSISLQGKHELSFDLKSPNTRTLVALKPISDYSSDYDWIGGWFDYPYKIGYNTNLTSVTVASITSDSNYHNFKFIIEDNDVTFYIDDVNKGTVTLDWLENHSDFSVFYWTWSGNRNPQVKNISIKPL